MIIETPTKQRFKTPKTENKVALLALWNKYSTQK